MTLIDLNETRIFKRILFFDYRLKDDWFLNETQKKKTALTCLILPDIMEIASEALQKYGGT